MTCFGGRFLLDIGASGCMVSIPIVVSPARPQITCSYYVDGTDVDRRHSLVPIIVARSGEIDARDRASQREANGSMGVSVTVRFAPAILFALCHSTNALATEPVFWSATIAAAEDSVRFGMAEARLAISDHWALSAAAAYLDPGPRDDEAQFRLGLIGALSLGAWNVENRHLLSASSASVERYRMRVRAVRPLWKSGSPLSARAFDEVFFDFDQKRVLRNNISVGLGVQFTQSVNAELYHVWEVNRAHPDNAYVLALLTYRL